MGTPESMTLPLPALQLPSHVRQDDWLNTHRITVHDSSPRRGPLFCSSWEDMTKKVWTSAKGAQHKLDGACEG